MKKTRESLDKMHEEFGEVIVLKENIIREEPLKMEYTFKNTFPYYKDVEKKLNEITPKKSVDILNWKNEKATHEMVSVDIDKFKMIYEEV